MLSAFFDNEVYKLLESFTEFHLPPRKIFIIIVVSLKKRKKKSKTEDMKQRSS